jgi:NADPH:quinone reductase-like Zn-dependent oxidoreductase
VATVNTSEADYHQKLTKLAEEHKATIAFDAVAGTLTGDVLSAMPLSSKIYVYGGLSEERPVISTRDLIFKKKSVAALTSALSTHPHSSSFTNLTQICRWILVERLRCEKVLARLDSMEHDRYRASKTTIHNNTK